MRSGSSHSRDSGSVVEPDRVDPAGSRPVDGELRVEVAGRPVVQLGAKQELAGSARAGDPAPALRNAARRASAPSTTGRSGARPMPPATTTRSSPAASSSAQVVPNGPRTPSSVPGTASCSARLTRADHPDHVRPFCAVGTAAADRDRYLAHAVRVEHHELPGPGGGQRPADRFQGGASPSPRSRPCARSPGAGRQDVGSVGSARCSVRDHRRGSGTGRAAARGWTAGGRARSPAAAGPARSRAAGRDRRARRSRSASSSVACTVPTARAPKCQRYGGTSQDQPSRSPGPRVCRTTRPCPGMIVSSATRPCRISQQRSARPPSSNSLAPSS